MRIFIVSALLLCACPLHATPLKPDRSRDVVLPPTTGGTTLVEVHTTQDGVKLASWTLLPSPKSDLKTVLLLAYGDSGNKSYWVPQALELRAAGFTVVLFDYRGFGGSDSVALDLAALYDDGFMRDLQTIATQVRYRYPHHTKVLWAFSMGTIIGTWVWPSLGFDGFFAEGFVTDLTAVVRRVEAMKTKTVNLPQSAARYQRATASLSAPLHLLAGTTDAVTTLADSKAFAAQDSSRTYQSFEGGHGGGWTALMQKGKRRNGYVTAMIRFSKKLRHP